MKYVDEANIENLKKVDVTSWDTVKDNVYIRLMNEKYIGKYDKDIAHIKFLDLAMTFSLQEKSKDTVVSHLLTNEDLKRWNIDIDTAQNIALQNTATDRKRRIMTFKESTLKNNMMYPLMRIPQGALIGAGGDSMSNCGIIEDTDRESGKENVLMVCHKNDMFGASYIAVPEVLDEVYSRFNNENFYIIPLSIHSVMCVRDKYVTYNGTKPIYEVEDDLLDMIESFNDEVNESWKDILSYKIYYYFGDDGKKIFPIK